MRERQCDMIKNESEKKRFTAATETFFEQKRKQLRMKDYCQILREVT